jgi:hypothetical protein
MRGPPLSNPTIPDPHDVPPVDTLGTAWAARRRVEFGPDPQGIWLDAKRLGQDGDARAAWVDSIEALLPAHACMGTDSFYKWTTRLGTWKLQLDARMFQRIGVSVSGPGGSWELADHQVGYVAAFLRLVGAIR